MTDQRNRWRFVYFFMDKMKSKIQNISYYISLGILLIIFVGTFAIFMYADITDTYDNSILFVKSLLKGQFRSFYSYSIENNRSFYAANYDPMIYALYGIWNIPVLMFSYFSQIHHMDLPFGLMWCKLFGVICIALTGLVMEKILALSGMKESQRKEGMILYFTGTCLYLVTLMIAQVDGPVIILLLLGLYYYMRSEMVRFVMCFALAMPTKMLAIILFFPLLLLKKKRIVWIVGNLLAVSSLSIFSRLFFVHDPAYVFALGSQSREAIIQIADSSFYWGHQTILFVVFYMAICTFCYLFDGSKYKEWEYEITIYIAFMVWAGFILFVDFNSYWVLYLLPFMGMSIIRAAGNKKIIIFLEMFFSVGYVGNVLFNCGPLRDPALGHRLIAVVLPWIFPQYNNTRYGTLWELVTSLGGDFTAPYFTSMMVGALILLMILLCPYYYHSRKYDEMGDKNVIIVRILMITGLFLISLYANFCRMPSEVFSTLSEDNMIIDTNIIQDGIVYQQEFESRQTKDLHCIEMQFSNPDYVRNNFCSVRIELLNSSNEILFCDRVGCAMIPSDQKIKVKVHGEVIEGETYSIRITGIPGAYLDRKAGRMLNLYVTKDLYDEAHPMKMNGIPTNANLYCRVY